MSLSGGKRGYEVKFPDFETSTLPEGYTEEILNNAILTKRDFILLKSNHAKSVLYSCSSVFMELFVDIDATVKKYRKRGNILIASCSSRKIFIQSKESDRRTK